jgi:hypothetical protein
VRSEVLTVVAIKGAVIQDARLLGLIEIHGRFGGSYFLELQGRRL